MSVGEPDSCFHQLKGVTLLTYWGIFVCPRTQKTFWCLIPINFHRVRHVPTSVGPGLCLLNLLTQIEVIQLPLRLGKLISPITTNNLLHIRCQQSLQWCHSLNGGI